MPCHDLACSDPAYVDNVPSTESVDGGNMGKSVQILILAATGRGPNIAP